MKTVPLDIKVLSNFRADKKENCWAWLGFFDRKGYGRIAHNHLSYMAHRLTYEYFVGPIPEGLVIDHLCNNPSCVNPKHLEPKTIWENAFRGRKFSRDRKQKNQVGELCSMALHKITSEADIYTEKYGTRRDIFRCKKCKSEYAKNRKRAK